MTYTRLVSFIVLLVVVVVQLLRPQTVVYSPKSSPTHTTWIEGEIDPIGFCPRTDLFPPKQATSPVRKMSLVEEARQIAAEFDYPAIEADRGVEKFKRQMGSYRMTTSFDNILR